MDDIRKNIPGEDNLPSELNYAKNDLLNNLHDTLEYVWDRCNCIMDTSAGCREELLAIREAAENLSKHGGEKYAKIALLVDKIHSVLDPIEGEFYSTIRRFGTVCDQLKELDLETQKENNAPTAHKKLSPGISAKDAKAMGVVENVEDVDNSSVVYGRTDDTELDEPEDAGMPLPWGVLPCASTKPDQPSKKK